MPAVYTGKALFILSNNKRESSRQQPIFYFMKKLLRQQKLAERLNHHPKIKAAKDLKIFRNLLKIKELLKAHTVLIYLPIHGEVNLRFFYKRFRLNKKIVLPRIIEKNKHLDLYSFKNLKTDVEKGSFGILGPKTHLPKVRPKEIEVALIAGVVFSLDGHRIGYGMGFYDRLLKKTSCLKIGVAYEFQIVKNGVGEKHDVKMDMIVTEKRIIVVKDSKKSSFNKKIHTS